MLQTCSNVQVQNMAGGSYHHCGIINGIKSVLDKFDMHDTVIKLQVNIDGLPLFRSTNAQCWPILGLITNFIVKEPFLIGLYYGNSKPTTAEEYLKQFVDEFSVIQQDGLWYMDKHYIVQLSAVVCDTPA